MAKGSAAVLLALLALVCPSWAQSDAGARPDGKARSGAAAKSQPTKPGRAPSPPPPVNSAIAPQPSPAHGAVIVAAAAVSRRATRALARLAYADPRLRPTIDEATAQVLAGSKPPAKASAKLVEIADVIEALPKACAKGCANSAVARRLLVSLGRELDAELVVVVEWGSGKNPTARVLRVAKGQFAPVVLTAQPATGKTPGELSWPDAVRIIRALVLGPLPGPRATGPASPKSSGTGAGKDDEEADEGGFDLFSSPWFWGGVGVVVAVGITVFALSQAGVDEPGTVRLEGRVSP